MQTPIQLEDLNKYIMCSNPQISPDGEKICFMATKTRIADNDYVTNLWLIDRNDGEEMQFTSGESDQFPVWSPDGTRIAFVSRRMLKKEDPGAELWIINMTGGEAQHLVTQKGGISNVRWSPDGEKLLFLSTVELQEEDEGVRVIQGLPIKFDGAGFIYNLKRQLFVLDLATKQLEQLTEAPMELFYADFSNDGERIAFVGEEETIRTLGMLKGNLFVIPTKGGPITKLTPAAMGISSLAWSPDDRYIAFQGSDLERGEATHANIFVISIQEQELQKVTQALDRTIMPSVYSDVAGPFQGPQYPIWEGKFIYFVVSDQGRVNIYRVSYPKVEIEPVVQGNIRVANFSLTNEVIAFSQTSPTNPSEIWIKEGETVRRLTKFNMWLQDHALVTPEHFKFTASDGQTIEGWLMHPLNVEAGKKYPALLNIHGGPKSTWGYGFLHEFQFFVANGYVLIYINPRGSGGYSEEFATVRGHCGERDYEDLMEGIDHVLNTYSFIDSDRLGSTGISYGGFMTCWIIGHTDRFRAAAPQAIVSNWYSLFGTSDLGHVLLTDLIGENLEADLWTAEEKYLRQSPIRYAKNAKTPTMVLHWEQDDRCPFEQGLQFFTALQYLGVESELVLLDGSSHGIFMVGKPKTKLSKIKHLKRWFDKYLHE